MLSDSVLELDCKVEMGNFSKYYENLKWYMETCFVIGMYVQLTLKLASEPVRSLSSSYRRGGLAGAGGGGSSPVLSSDTDSESELG